MMKKELTICNLNTKPGEKTQGFINILDTNTKLPITIINGEKQGKTILITAGVHGCEYPGIKTAMELASQIDPKDVSGNIIIVPIVNTEGFEKRSAGVTPEDKKNILRVFPGNKNGTISEKIAHVITTELISKADYYFDLHGGDLHENLVPHIYYPAQANEEVIDECIELVKNFNVPYYALSNNKNGTFTSSAIYRNVPSLLIERGGCGLCKEEDVKKYKDDILNILNVLNVVKYERTEKTYCPQKIKQAVYLNSFHSGCWTCFVKAGENIKKGQKLGEVSDYFGNIIETHYALFDAVVLYNTVAYYVEQDSSIIAYGCI